MNCQPKVIWGQLGFLGGVIAISGAFEFVLVYLDSWFTLNVLSGFQYIHANCQTCLKTMKAVSQLKHHLFVPKLMNHCCVPDLPIAQTACFLSLTLNTNLMENPANFQME